MIDFDLETEPVSYLIEAVSCPSHTLLLAPLMPQRTTTVQAMENAAPTIAVDATATTVVDPSPLLTAPPLDPDLDLDLALEPLRPRRRQHRPLHLLRPNVNLSSILWWGVFFVFLLH